MDQDNKRGGMVGYDPEFKEFAEFDLQCWEMAKEVSDFDPLIAWAGGSSAKKPRTTNQRLPHPVPVRSATGLRSCLGPSHSLRLFVTQVINDHMNRCRPLISVTCSDSKRA